MKRYLILYLNFLRFSFTKAMWFRVDFFTKILMDVVFYAINISFFKLVFQQTGVLGGWTEPQAMVFVAIYLVIDAIFMTVFSNNMWMLPLLINKGDLDYYLVRPVGSLFFVCLREFGANSFVNLLMTVGIFIWALGQYPGPVTALNLSVLFVLIINGCLLYAALDLLFIMPVFWTSSPRGLATVFFNVSRLIERPDRVYTGAMRIVVTTVLPFSVMASYPARMFIEGFDWIVLLHTAVVSAVFWLLVCLMWRAGLRVYSSASS